MAWHELDFKISSFQRIIFYEETRFQKFLDQMFFELQERPKLAHAVQKNVPTLYILNYFPKRSNFERSLYFSIFYCLLQFGMFI